MQKYFLSDDDFLNKTITSDDSFHIKTVMRSKIGDLIVVSNQVKSYIAKITDLTSIVKFEIVEEKVGNTELPFFLTLFQGYPKSDKLDDIIKHTTELGVTYIYPTIMARSVFKLDDKKKDAKLERFNKIAKEAAEQSGRIIIPVVKDILNLKSIDFSLYEYKILCYEESAKQGEASNLSRIIKLIKPNSNVCFLVGPEGGISDNEVDFLYKKGFIKCALGPRILRTEVASLYVLSAISYALELSHD